jgi:hypothetical protein
MDPISLAVGGVLFAAGFLVGKITRRRSKDDGVKAICGCGHGLEKHDPKDGACHGEEQRSRFEDGHWTGHEYVQCACRQYTGPRPIEELFAPKFLPPQD